MNDIITPWILPLSGKGATFCLLFFLYLQAFVLIILQRESLAYDFSTH
jgi:hypothetical protein